MTDHLTATLAPYGLRCEHQVAPLGICTWAPLLSWRVGTTRRGDDPVSYRVVVTAVSSGDETVSDSGEVADPTVVSVRGPELAPRIRYQWQVTVTSADELTNSAGSSFETGHDDWIASWITPDPSDVDVVDAPDEGDVALPDHGLRPPIELRREFTVQTTPNNARLYFTARGPYEAHLNSHRVGDHEPARAGPTTATASATRPTTSPSFSSPVNLLEVTAFEVLPDDLVPHAVDRLVELVTDAGPAVAKGFLGVSLIAAVLDQHGHLDLAHAHPPPTGAVSTGRAHGTSRSVAAPAPRGPEWTVC